MKEQLKTLVPQMGDLLKCWWPQDEQPNQTGPKFRPVFFWGIAFVGGKKHFAVSYGTSQVDEWKETKNGGNVFVPRKVSDRFHNVDTRYDFNKIKLIPATEEYFTADKKGAAVVIGAFPKDLLGQAGDAMARASVPKRLAALGVVMK